MKWAHALVALAVSLSLTADSPLSKAEDQNAGKQDQGKQAGALAYKEGTVFSLVFVRTKPGGTDEYLSTVASGWKQVVEEMKRQKLILSYRVFRGGAANKDDWDVMLLIEYENMAALDGIDEKVQAIMSKVLRGPDVGKLGYAKRSELRDVLGEKVVRELILQK
jgi:hypothetical protein